MKTLLLAFLGLVLTAGHATPQPATQPIQEIVAPWYITSSTVSFRIAAYVNTWQSGRNLEWVRVRVYYNRYDVTPNQIHSEQSLVLLGAMGEANVSVNQTLAPGSYIVTVLVEYGVYGFNFEERVTYTGGAYMYDVQILPADAIIAQIYPIP